MGKSNMPSSLVSHIPSFAEVGVSGNLSDTVLAFQMLSWDDFGHFFRHPRTFLTFVLSGAHLVPVLRRELFLVVTGQSHLSSGPRVHLSTLPQVSLSSSGVLHPTRKSHHSATLQVAQALQLRFCRSTQCASPTGWEHWSWPRNLISGHYYTQLSGHEIHAVKKRFQ